MAASFRHSKKDAKYEKGGRMMEGPYYSARVQLPHTQEI